MALILVLFLLNVALGSVSIPTRAAWNILWGAADQDPIWTNIILKSRVPQTLVAIVAGAGLAISGLHMQTVFRNPLAGPSVLGICSGASLGVAFVVLLSGSIGGVALSRLGFAGDIALTVGAIAGALAVMALIVYVSQRVKGNVTLLIIGVMIGYVANAIIGVLKYFSVEEDIRAYVVWGLGSFSRVSGNQMSLFVTMMCILLPLSFLLTKTLNLLLLGDAYARNLGLNIKLGYSGGRCNCVLRSHQLPGTGCTSSVSRGFPHIGPSYSHPCLRTYGCAVCTLMQPYCTYAGHRGCSARQLGHCTCGCACSDISFVPSP